MSFLTLDSYGNKVVLPGDTGPSTKSDGIQYGLVEDRALVSDGFVLSKGTNSTSALVAESIGLTPVAGAK